MEFILVVLVILTIVTMLPSVADGRTITSGAPSVRATPEMIRQCVLALKSSIARTTFMSAFVGIAWTKRSSRYMGGSSLAKTSTRRGGSTAVSR